MSDVDAHAGRGGGSGTGPLGGRSRRGRVSPSAMSRIGLVLAVAAAVWFTEGGLRGALVGSLLLSAVLVTDPVAERLRAGRRDRLEVWLAPVLGRLREYVVYAGLAIGGTAVGVPGAWAWAGGALAALALRDSVAQARRADVGEPEWSPESGRPRPIDAVDPSRRPDDGAPGDASLTAELLGGPLEPADPASERSERSERSQPHEAGTGAGAADADGHGDHEGHGDGHGDGLFGIRTVPKGVLWPGWSQGRADALGGPADGHGPADGAVVPRDTDGTGIGTGTDGTGARADAPPPSLLARAAAFPQVARFATVAVTVTIWDARVTFIALIAGCVLAATAELAGRSDDETAR